MIDLYTAPTPNGWKVSVMLEETGLPYEVHPVDLMKGQQKTPEFLALNPNGRIPVIVDREADLTIFESGAILMYLAEKFGEFLPTDPSARAECLSWLFWQMGSAPYLGGGFGHFYAYAPTKIQYAIDRFTMEVKRQLDVLDRQLADNRYLCGDDYTIADMAVWPWYGGLVMGWQYDSGEFLNVEIYTNVKRWADETHSREPVRRGRMVNRVRGEASGQLRERHDAGDFETKTQDKLEAAD